MIMIQNIYQFVKSRVTAEQLSRQEKKEGIDMQLACLSRMLFHIQNPEQRRYVLDNCIKGIQSGNLNKKALSILWIQSIK